jgi:8-oxo-dGTP pyrophosphatase MutT (NUDIX family)
MTVSAAAFGAIRPVTASLDVFLESTDPLTLTNAVAALLVLGDGRYVMQLRDFKPHIFYPGHWGLFGGAIEAGESENDALRRELHEELGLMAGILTRFVRLDFDLSAIGAGKVYRAVYVVPVTDEQFAAFDLREGLACEPLTAREILTERMVVPYDSFAVWMHHARLRLGPRARTKPAPGCHSTDGDRT